MVEIYFLRRVVEDDLRSIGRHDIPRILRKLTVLETDAFAGAPLGGELTGFRKLVVGRNTSRVVYRVRADGAAVDICDVWAVGHRRNSEVYAEATRRVRLAASTRPELLSLAELMTTIGRLDTAAAGPTGPPPDPVPEWLFKQLVHTAGRPAHEIAAMSGEEAFAAWNDWMTRPR